MPRLNEGDQIVLINGRDISEHTHDQVVMFIKASCESHSGELILLVRPNGEHLIRWCLASFYSCIHLIGSVGVALIVSLFVAIYDVVEEKLESEPDFQYIPEKSPTDASQLDQDAWKESMLQLKEGLNSGTILAHFDVSNYEFYLSRFEVF